MYDVFISHASEDKAEVALPLALYLQEHRLKVWLDAFELTIGDSLRQKIDRGLAESRFGIVILSRNFFKKEWTQRELDGLIAKEQAARKVILPIWHNISKEEVASFSPMLADKLAVSTAQGIEYVAEQILRVVKLESNPQRIIKPKKVPQKKKTSTKRRKPAATSVYIVLISHSSSDSWVATQIAEEVRALGAQVLLNDMDAELGGTRLEKIMREASATNEAIVLISKNSLNSRWVSFEIGALSARRKRVTPILHNVSHEAAPLIQGLKAFDLNEFNGYLIQLKERIGRHARDRRSRGEDMAYKVFISYTSKDTKLAQDLGRKLEGIGAKVSPLEESAVAGESLETPIKRNLRAADEVFVILTDNSINNPLLISEMGAAFSLSKRVTPTVVGVDHRDIPAIIQENYIRWADLPVYISFLEKRAKER